MTSINPARADVQRVMRAVMAIADRGTATSGAQLERSPWTAMLRLGRALMTLYFARQATSEDDGEVLVITVDGKGAPAISSKEYERRARCERASRSATAATGSPACASRSRQQQEVEEREDGSGGRALHAATRRRREAR
jgi:hypothetical protein